MPDEQTHRLAAPIEQIAARESVVCR